MIRRSFAAIVALTAPAPVSGVRLTSPRCPTGSLLVSDDDAGAIYRITYTSTGR